MATIARFTIMNRRRELAALEDRTVSGDTEVDVPCSQSVAESAIKRFWIADMLSELSPEDRQIFSLRFEQGTSYREISQQLGIKEDRVRNVLHRVRKTLRQRFEEEM